MLMNTYALKRILRTSAFGRSKFYLFIRYCLYRNRMDDIIDRYKGENLNKEQRSALKKKMRRAMIDYRWDFDEFFIFHFEDYDDAKRRSFVPEFDKNIFADMVNDKMQADVFLDKWTTYEYFKDFFGRDVFNVRHLSDLDSEGFFQFITKHPSFIMKPIYGTRGIGIQVFTTNTVQKAQQVLTGLYNSGITDMILEELIDQDDRLSALHKESANTLRVITIKYDDNVEVIRSYLRIGKGKSFIDNASAGGVFGVVNVDTGKIYAACDRYGNVFDKHPDTNMNLIGFEIPYWEDVKNLAKKAAEVLPKVRYVGWDIAVTKTGCVLIEGNDKGRWSFQIPKQEGFREEMNTILKKLGKPELR